MHPGQIHNSETENSHIKVITKKQQSFDSDNFVWDINE